MLLLLGQVREDPQQCVAMMYKRERQSETESNKPFKLDFHGVTPLERDRMRTLSHSDMPDECQILQQELQTDVNTQTSSCYAIRNALYASAVLSKIHPEYNCYVWTDILTNILVKKK